MVDPKDPFKQTREARLVLHKRQANARAKQREESVEEADDSAVIVRTLSGRTKPSRKR